MAFQFVNYFLNDFDIEQNSTENNDSVWNSAELYHYQNLNHSRTPNINYQISIQSISLHWRPCKKIINITKSI